MRLTARYIDSLMLAALAEAKNALELGEIPIGAVLARDRKIIASAHNLVEAQTCVARHAEILAIEAASNSSGNWRLTDTVLCVTIEPCTMCSGAIKLSRVGTVIFGARDPSMGAFGSLYDLSVDKRVGHVPRVIQGIREEECARLMKEFFQARRKK